MVVKAKARAVTADSVQVPLSKNAVTVLERRYLIKDETGRVIETPDERADASTFWKLLTAVESLEVWSALPRLTVAAFAITKVLVPLPPSIEVSVP